MFICPVCLKTEFVRIVLFFGYAFFVVFCILNSTLFALSIVFLKQFSEVFVFPASRFKVEDLVFDAHPQVIKRFLQTIDTFFKFLAVCLCLLGKFGQLSMLGISCLSEFLNQFVKFVFQI